MAIDTADKRNSAIHVLSPWRGMLPLPDGTIGDADRQHVALLYSGIAVDAESTSLAITRYGNFTTCHVRVVVTESGWTDTVRGGYVEVSIGGQWHRGSALFETYDSDELHAVIFGLEENTTYSVRVTFKRYDVSGGDPYLVTANGLEDSGLTVLETITDTGNVTTRNSQVTTGGGRNLYVSSSLGSNSNDGLSPSTPKKTPGSGVGGLSTLTIVGGDTVHIMDLDLDPALASNDKRILCNGSANSYVLIKPYSERSRVIGWKALNGPWTLHSGTIWKMDMSDNIRSVVDDHRDGQEIYAFRALTTDVPQSVWAIEPGNVGDGSGFYHDGVNNVLYVRLHDGANPGSGRLRGAYKEAFRISSSSYFVVDGLRVELAGTTDGANPPSSVNRYGAMIASCDNWIIRNCVFDGAELSVEGTSNVNGLIENTKHIRRGPWEQLFDVSVLDPYDQLESWSKIKDGLMGGFAINIEVGDGMVIRRNFIDGFCGFNCSQNETEIGRMMDVHDNIVLNNPQQHWQTESNSAIGSAFFNNYLTGGSTTWSCSPSNKGPLWFVGNAHLDYLHSPLKFGSQVSADEGHAFKIFVNNTCVTTRDTADDDGTEMTLVFNGTFSGAIAVNNIFVCRPAGSTKYVFNGGSTGGTIDTGRINYFDHNVFCLDLLGTPVLRWDTTYASFEAMTAALSETDVSVTNSTIVKLSDGANYIYPAPNGPNQPATESLLRAGAEVPGITNVMAHDAAWGFLPPRIGWFNGFRYTPTTPTEYDDVTEQNKTLRVGVGPTRKQVARMS